MELVFFAAMVLAVPASLYAAKRAKARERAEWEQAARAAGLEHVLPETGTWFKGILTARTGPHTVRIEEYARGEERGTRVIVEGNSGLTLRAEKDVQGWQRAMGPREVEIGDEAFDSLVYVEGGDPALLRAVLDVATRGLVRRFLDGTLCVAGSDVGLLAGRAAVLGGDLVLETRSLDDRVLRAGFAAVLGDMLELARRLQRPSGVVKRLVEVTRQEVHWRMRLENLKLLAGTFPHHAAVRELLAEGCEDGNQQIQLHCALGLGADDPRGRATLLDMAARGWSDDAVSARAIAALGRALPPDRAATILGHALRTRREETAHACLQALGASGAPGAVDPLAKVMRVEKGALSVAAARALGASALPAAEAPLLEALGAEDAALRLAAVEALGVAGSASAVLALKEAAEREGGLRRAARQAIAAIQSRSGATPGGVSLADTGSGAVSLADEMQAGRVSIAGAREGG